MRRDTSAQAEAAELLTVAQLALRGLIVGQYPRNYPGLDVFVFAADGSRANIQVKYRNRFRDSSVSISSLDGVDFLVIIRGNRDAPTQRSNPTIWVVPAQAAKTLWLNGRLRLSRIPSDYLAAWDLIEAFCNGDADAKHGDPS